jgi:hypothetical protein
MNNAKNKKIPKNSQKLIVANLAQPFPKPCHLCKEDSAEPRNSVASQMDPATTHNLQAGQRGYLKNSHGSCQFCHASMVKPISAFGHRARELNFLLTMKSRHEVRRDKGWSHVQIAEMTSRLFVSAPLRSPSGLCFASCGAYPSLEPKPRCESLHFIFPLAVRSPRAVACSHNP